MKSKSIIVPKKLGESVRQILADSGNLNKNVLIEGDAEFIYIPITSEARLSKETAKYKVATRDFKEAAIRPKTYTDIIDVPPSARSLLPRAFDIIGDVAIIKIPPELKRYKKRIGAAILAANKSVRAVASDEGVKEEYRVRRLSVIAGRKSTSTVHTENGIKVAIDPAKAYYSPRLATERMAVAKQVKDRENVLDMFAGVGPFSLTLAKKTKAARIYAIDINPSAVRYLKKNIELNKIKNIIALLGDAREASNSIEGADRIIMNLPHTAKDFFGCALKCAKRGCVIHYYAIIPPDDADKEMEKLCNIAKECGRRIKLVNCREVRNYSPSECQMAFDIMVSQ